MRWWWNKRPTCLSDQEMVNQFYASQIKITILFPDGREAVDYTRLVADIDMILEEPKLIEFYWEDARAILLEKSKQ